MAKHETDKQETSADWTELLSTRVSPRTKKKLEEVLRATATPSSPPMSASTWLRKLVLKELRIDVEGA